jgi:hypothetical protein
MLLAFNPANSLRASKKKPSGREMKNRSFTVNNNIADQKTSVQTEPLNEI